MSDRLLRKWQDFAAHLSALWWRKNEPVSANGEIITPKRKTQSKNETLRRLVVRYHRVQRRRPHQIGRPAAHSLVNPKIS